MDKFVTVVKSSVGPARSQAEKRKSSTYRYNPYDIHNEPDKRVDGKSTKEKTKEFVAPLLKDGAKPSSAALTKHLLSTLTDNNNPITHSDIYERSDHIESAASGHQRSERRMNQKTYWDSRKEKLSQQLPEKPMARECNVLRNVRIYIDGYLAGTTDIEMKRIVTLAGGQVLYTASGATHILTSQQLSGSKTHKLLTTRSRATAHVVKPEWITDSIQAGRRLPEREYSAIKDMTCKNLFDMFQAQRSTRTIDGSKKG